MAIWLLMDSSHQQHWLHNARAAGEQRASPHLSVLRPAEPLPPFIESSMPRVCGDTMPASHRRRKMILRRSSLPCRPRLSLYRLCFPAAWRNVCKLASHSR